MNRCRIVPGSACRTLLLWAVLALSWAQPPAASTGDNWYEQSLFLLHEDHHVEQQDPVGQGVDPDQIRRLLRLARPDHVQMIAKGAYGITTYPTKVGFAPSQLGADVLGLWRDAARAEGIRFGVYVNPCNDREIRIRHPEWLRLGPDGKPRDSAARSPNASRSGMVGPDGRQWSIALCMQSGALEGYVWPLLREILTGYAPDSLWLDGLGGQADPCYCPRCRSQFTQAFRQSVPLRPADAGWAELKAMQRGNYHEFLRRTIAEVHRLKPTCLVTHNGAYAPWMPEQPPPGFGFLAKDYLDHGDAISPYCHYLDSVGLPYEIMTEVFTANPDLPSDAGWTERETKPKPPEQIKRELAAILANGGRYNLWDIPARNSALVEERWNLIGNEVVPFLRSRAQWCLGTRVPDVSVAFSSQAHYAKTEDSPKLFSDDRQWLKEVDDRFREMHLDYEYVPDWRLERGEIRGQVLLIEDPASIAPALVEAARRFARKGGRVIWTGNARAPLLEAALGIRFADRPAEKKTLTVGDAGTETPWETRCHQVSSTTARVVLPARTEKGERFPYLLVNEGAGGRWYYAAGPLVSGSGRTGRLPPNVLQAVWSLALPEKERRLVADASPLALVTLRQKDAEHVIHVANQSPGRRRNGTWRGRDYQVITDVPPLAQSRVRVKLPEKPTAVFLQPQGVKIADWEYREGKLELAVPPVEFHQMVVVVP